MENNFTSYLNKYCESKQQAAGACSKEKSFYHGFKDSTLEGDFQQISWQIIKQHSSPSPRNFVELNSHSRMQPNASVLDI